VCNQKQQHRMIHNQILLLIFLLVLNSCSDWTVSEEIVKKDFSEIYPDYEFISSGVGEGDMVVAYVHVRYNKPESDSIYEEVWQYWKNKNGWQIRHEFIEKKTKQRFFDQMESNKYQWIDFSKLSQKDWNQVIVLTPYTNPKVLKDSLQIKNIDEIKNIGIEHRDDISLILFIHGNLIVEYFTCPRTIDFSLINNINGFPKNKAKFEIEKTNQSTISGEKIYRLTKMAAHNKR